VSYTYPIDPQAMFDDRTDQFVSLGIPAADVTQMRAAVSDMWANEPGGWVYEWSALARRYAEGGDHYLTSLAYGCAKFPCLADAAKAAALQAQIREYVAAAPGFPLRFERRMVPVAYRGGTINVAAHLLTTAADHSQAPVLVATGGVDTWKMDSHAMWLALAQGAGVTVFAFDHPGTGETTVPLNAHADEVVLGLVAEARKLGNGRVAHFGMSFGGNFSAMTGLRGAVDAAVVLGGPVDKAFGKENAGKLPFGMPDILGNAFGFDHRPSAGEFADGMAQLSRTKLLQHDMNAPMLVINGADDYFVPQADTLVFHGRADTEVQLLPDSGHCAMSRLPDVLRTTTGWLRTQLSTGATP